MQADPAVRSRLLMLIGSLCLIVACAKTPASAGPAAAKDIDPGGWLGQGLLSRTT
jgi:hypothetical protein